MKSIILIESKTARQEYIGKASILNTIKPPVPVLTTDGRSTIKQVAEWYGVGEETVKKILQRNRVEFSIDGIKIITAKEYKNLEFIGGQSAPLKIPRNSITLLPKQAILRIGMLLTDSQRATKVRDLLIAGEKQLTYRQKTKAVREAESWKIEREASKKVRRMTTDAIKNNLPEEDKWAFKNFTNLVYLAVFGKIAKKLREERGAKTNDNLRDGFTETELSAIQNAEFVIAGLVEAGLTYHDVKKRIQKRDFWPKAKAM